MSQKWRKIMKFCTVPRIPEHAKNKPEIQVLHHNRQIFSILKIVDHHPLSVTNMSNLSTKYVLSMYGISDVDNRCLFMDESFYFFEILQDSVHPMDWNNLKNYIELDFMNFLRSVSYKIIPRLNGSDWCKIILLNTKSSLL